MRILSERDVEALLDLDELVEALARAMAALSAGSASVPPRVAASVPDRGLLAAMPAYLPGAGALTTKLVSVFPGNATAGLPTHQAVIAAFDPATGVPVAVMDGRRITAARTAAGSALATRLLARPESEVLAILGTGVQARAHAVAVPRVRTIREIRVAGRDPARARSLVDDLGPPARAVPSFREAVLGADVVCATTHAPEPVVRRDWLAPGTHVNSVGYSLEGVELDDATVADAVVVVESRQAALAPPPSGANDLVWRIRDGVITESHVHAEVGELVTRARPGRTSAEQITLYKSVGVAVQDAAAAALVLAAAEARGVGIDVEL